MLGEIIWDSTTIFWVCIFSVPIVAIIADYWHKIEKVKSDNELKRSMIDRGMTVDDIERVVSAGKKKE